MRRTACEVCARALVASSGCVAAIFVFSDSTRNPILRLSWYRSETSCGKERRAEKKIEGESQREAAPAKMQVLVLRVVRRLLRLFRLTPRPTTTPRRACGAPAEAFQATMATAMSAAHVKGEERLMEENDLLSVMSIRLTFFRAFASTLSLDFNLPRQSLLSSIHISWLHLCHGSSFPPWRLGILSVPGHTAPSLPPLP